MQRFLRTDGIDCKRFARNPEDYRGMEGRQNQMASEFRLRNGCVGSRPIEGGGGVPRGAPKVPAAGSRRTDGARKPGKTLFF